MEQVLYTGPHDPPIVRGPQITYWMRVSIPVAITLLILGPAMVFFGMAYSLSDAYLVNQNLDPILRKLANLGVILGVMMSVFSLGWLVCVVIDRLSR